MAIDQMGLDGNHYTIKPRKPISRARDIEKQQNILAVVVFFRSGRDTSLKSRTARTSFGFSPISSRFTTRTSHWEIDQLSRHSVNKFTFPGPSRRALNSNGLATQYSVSRSINLGALYFSI